MMKNKQWCSYKIVDVFTGIQRGKRLKKEDHYSGNTPYISSTGINNGVDNYIGNQSNIRFFSNCLTLANSGSIGSVFFHPYKFVANDHVTKLQNIDFNSNSYLFVSTIIKRLSEKYGFNREINDKRIKNERVLLPIDSKKQPNYDLMESYIKDLKSQKERAYLDYIGKRVELLKDIKKPIVLEEKEWKEFCITELFNKIIIGKNIDGNKVDKINGIYAYITRKESHNGLDGFINEDINFLNTNTPALTIGNETAEPFIQEFPFFTGTKVNILTNSSLNAYILKFIATSLRSHKSKYSYSYTINSNRLKKQKILLPINKDQQPDYEYMEQYMKYLEYQKLKAYLAFKKIT